MIANFIFWQTICIPSDKKGAVAVSYYGQTVSDKGRYYHTTSNKRQATRIVSRAVTIE